jgi:hypothetical protein
LFRKNAAIIIATTPNNPLMLIEIAFTNELFGGAGTSSLGGVLGKLVSAVAGSHCARR